MAKFEFHGKFSHILRSCLTLSRVASGVLWRRLWGSSLTPDWTIDFEIGTIFWREQYIYGLALPDIREGRAYLNSLVTLTGENFAVQSAVTLAQEPKGDWHILNHETDLTILYLHGGGYSLYPKTAYYFGKMIADYLSANVFMPDYRLAPENPHPAQLEDGSAAYKYLLEKGIDPKKLVVIGESGGGNLALKLILKLRNNALPQPILAICLCPWTGVGKNSDSLFGNDTYDILQGIMMTQFSKPLPGKNPTTIVETPPLELDFKNVAPIYIQAGGREVLIDLIDEFAETISHQNVEMIYDKWPNMVHVFQMHGRAAPESAEAFKRMQQAIDIKLKGNEPIPHGARTIVSSG